MTIDKMSFLHSRLTGLLLLLAGCAANNAESRMEKKDSPVIVTTGGGLTTNTLPSLYIDDGGRGGIPVLFVHSFAGSTKHWQAQLDHFRKTQRAVAFDIRGHGLSQPSPGNDFAVETIASDIGVVVKSLQLKNFILVGHSLGAAAALVYASRYPERVHALVLEGVPPKTPAEQVRQIDASLKADKYDTVVEKYVTTQLKNGKPSTREMETEGMKKLSKEATMSIIKTTLDFDGAPYLKKYPGKILLINTPAENTPQSLHQQFPAIPFIEVPGTSHWIQLDDPVKINELLDDFFEKTAY